MKVVLGMHRSGTSLVTRLFHLAGANVGDQETMLRGDEFNPDGYFEQLGVMDLNNRLINGPIGRFAYFCLPSTQTILRRAGGAKLNPRLVHAGERLAETTVKDPRFCLTLPAWRQCGAEIEQAIVCLRHPVSIAHSLKRRNHLPLWFSISLWRQHLERMLVNLEEIPTWYIRYENLFDDEGLVRELLPTLAFAGIPSSPEAIRELAGNVRDALNHCPFRHDHDRLLSGQAKELWEFLEGQHERQGDLVRESMSSAA